MITESPRRSDSFLRRVILMKGHDDMLILSRVCADFHNKKGELVHRVTPANRLTFHEAPEAIREDPLFRMLLAERSLEVSDNGPRKRKLENDPEAAEQPKAENESRPAASSRKSAAKP